jgi:hypothetical protein
MLVAFADGSTAIVSGYVELGRSLFNGTVRSCLRRQNELCSPHDGLLVLKTMLRAKTKATLDVMVLVDSLIQCGLTIRPVERQSGIEHRRYNIIGVSQRLGCHDVFVLLDDGKIYRFYDAALDKYLFVVCGDGA